MGRSEASRGFEIARAGLYAVALVIATGGDARLLSG